MAQVSRREDLQKLYNLRLRVFTKNTVQGFRTTRGKITGEQVICTPSFHV